MNIGEMQDVIKGYSRVKGKDVSEEIEAFINLCKIMGYKIKMKNVSRVWYIDIECEEYTIEINGFGDIQYTDFSSRKYRDIPGPCDFKVNCRDIDEEELFSIMLSRDLNRINEYRRRLSTF